MSKEDGSITLRFGDGEYAFRLAYGQFRELQESINRPRIDIGEPPIGPKTLLLALFNKDAWPHDVREVIRLGLIGGGMKSDRALVLIKRYIEGVQPWFDQTDVARQVLQVALLGVPDDPVGKAPAPPLPETAATTESSGFQPSTGSALQ